MTVRLKLALTIFATGIVTALLVIATVLYAFQRFEHETTYRRGSAFLMRVVANFDNLFEMHERNADEFQGWLRNMVLFEPDTQLYLLGLDGTVLASSGNAKLAPDFKVALKPVLEAVGHSDAAYVMGDDPERMDANAVVAVEPVRRMPAIESVGGATSRTAANDTAAKSAEPIVGYLYLVLHTGQLPEGRWAAVRMSFGRPALGLIVAVVAFTTLVAVLIIVSVTRPLQRLTDAVSTVSQRGLDAGLPNASQATLPPITPDEFGQLTRAFEMMLNTLRKQWGELRRLDHFRREGVSNLSHDLRSPLTATVACLETLEGRWSNNGAETLHGIGPADLLGARTLSDARAEDRRLVEIALRNTRNAARLVQSLGDLAKLDEPEFKLHREVVDVGELLDDICIRFVDRAAKQGVTLTSQHADESATATPPSVLPLASLDIELFERAIANVVDNALKFCTSGARITLSASVRDDRVVVTVSDTGPGISESDLPHLFDRFYQSRQSVAPATGEGGKGLGLAIVKRIAELHDGAVAVASVVGEGTQVVLRVPAMAR
jgi:signal transduction histidine kinase